MSKLEIFLVFVSVIETVITVVLHRKMKRKLKEAHEKLLYEQSVYESLNELFPTGRNTR